MTNDTSKQTAVMIQVDKTVVKVTGLSVKGLNIQDLEAKLREKVAGIVRIIGVTGDSLEMDVYGVDEEYILRNEEGIIKAVSMAEGIKTNDLTALASVKSIQSVDIDHIPEYVGPCSGERWHRHAE